LKFQQFCFQASQSVSFEEKRFHALEHAPTKKKKLQGKPSSETKLRIHGRNNFVQIANVCGFSSAESFVRNASNLLVNLVECLRLASQ